MTELLIIIYCTVLGVFGFVVSVNAAMGDVLNVMPYSKEANVAFLFLVVVFWPLALLVFLGQLGRVLARGFVALWREALPHKVKVPRAVARERGGDV